MSVLSAGIAGAAALGSAIYGGVSAGKMNKRAVKFQREMWDKQGERELQYWNMQNEYNSPVAQMQRLREAGLNPNLVYGSGADAQGANLRAGGAPSMPSQMSEAIDLSSIAQTALAVQQTKAAINRTQAETDRIKQGTAVGQFELNAMQELGQSAFTRRLAAETTKLSLEDERKIIEFSNWLQLAYPNENNVLNVDMDILGHVPTAPSKFIQGELKAVVDKAMTEVANLKAGVSLRNQQQSINELEMIIKRAEAEFTKMVGSKTGAGFALQLLRTILGK